MSEMPPSAARYETRQTPLTNRNLGSRLLWVATLPVVAATLFGTAAAVYLLLRPPDASRAVSWTVVGAALAGCLVAILVAVLRARALAQRLRYRTDDVRDSIARFREELRHSTEQWGRGEPPNPFGIETPVAEGDELADIQNDLLAAREMALTALVDLPQPVQQVPGIAVPENAGNVNTHVDVFVNLSRRLQALLHQEIQLLDEMESQVEDPDFLKGLFSIDHLATRIRRHAENLAVLGGAATRRQWSRPVAVNDILRSAVAEVEQYVRVKLVRPIEGSVQGHAVADVVHLVAELVENATRFSAPQTQVLLRTELVTAGLAVEVEDRGLGIPREEQNKINAMLVAPDVVNFDELLRDGRIGLFVVGALAQRHGIAVQVQTNIFGGTQAVMVLPTGLLGESDPSESPEAQSEAVATEPAEPSNAAAPLIPAQQIAQEMTATQEMEAVSAPPAMEPVSAPPPVPSSGPPAAPASGPPAAPASGPPAAPESVRPQSSPRSPRPRPAPMTANDLPAQSAPVGGELSWSSPSPAPRPSPRPTPPDEERPQLPQRRRQAHLAPQLRDAPTENQHGEPETGHDPGLMNAFKRGMTRADEKPEEVTGHGDDS